MEKYIPVVKENYNQIMKGFSEIPNYTELINNMSLPDLELTLKIKIRKDIYQVIRTKLAKIYDSLACEIKKLRK